MSAEKRVSSRWMSVALLLIIAGAAIGVWWWRLRPADVPAPPRPASLDQADPTVRDLIVRGMEIVRTRPTDAESRRELGMMFEANGFFAEAAACYQTAVDLAPDDWLNHYRLALAQGNRLSEIERALAHLQRAVDLNPAYPAGHWRLGFWLLDLGRTADAEQRFKAALDLDRHSPAARLGMARVRLDQQAYREAVRLLEPLWQARSPNTPYASLLLGRAYRGLGEDEAARSALLRGQGSTPVLGDEHQTLPAEYRVGVESQMEVAKMFAQQGQTARAVQVLETLVAQRSDDLNLVNNLAIAYRTNNQLPQAERTVRDLLDVHAEFAPGHLSLAAVLYQQSFAPQADRTSLRDEAMAHLDRALTINPSLSDALRHKATMFEEDGLYAEAARSWLDVVRADPSDPFASYQAGRVARLAGLVAEAVEQLEQSVTAMPLPVTLLELAQAYMDQGRLEEAARTIGRAVDLNPNQPGIEQATGRYRSLQQSG